jgi:GTP:adenosylcobinamide-phosphate guanylyltransferase
MLNIIVQAGGKGTRMRNVAWNKPKCLISINNKPILYHLFELYSEANFHIICDYKKDILEKYLLINKPNINVNLVEAEEGSETCSGMQKCLKHIKDDEQILITWSDILYEAKVDLPEEKNNPVIYKTNCFPSRYKVVQNQIVKQKTHKDGIAGIFFIPNKKYLNNVDKSGSFLKWFIKNINDYRILEANNIKEIGDYEQYEKILNEQKSHRFFNKIEFTENNVIKQCINKNYSHLIDKEKKWYKNIEKYNLNFIAKIVSEQPYQIKKISGFHLFNKNLDDDTIRQCIINTINSLKKLHKCEKIPSSEIDLRSVYVHKTIERVNSIKNILPFNDKKFITVNGKKCENIFYTNETQKHKFNEIFSYLNNNYFTPIHGDPTLSNILFQEDKNPIFIDPRGYFYKEGIWGDPYYDFSKLYFSCVGKYDFFNKKDFILYIGEESVEIFFKNDQIEKIFEKEILKHFNQEEVKKMEIIHSLIWLSMSAYAIDDVDSIIASHYLGLYYLEKAIGNTNE